MTVGALREAIAGFSDTTPLFSSNHGERPYLGINFEIADRSVDGRSSGSALLFEAIHGGVR